MMMHHPSFMMASTTVLLVIILCISFPCFALGDDWVSLFAYPVVSSPSSSCTGPPSSVENILANKCFESYYSAQSFIYNCTAPSNCFRYTYTTLNCTGRGQMLSLNCTENVQASLSVGSPSTLPRSIILSSLDPSGYQCSPNNTVSVVLNACARTTNNGWFRPSCSPNYSNVVVVTYYIGICDRLLGVADDVTNTSCNGNNLRLVDNAACFPSLSTTTTMMTTTSTTSTTARTSTTITTSTSSTSSLSSSLRASSSTTTGSSTSLASHSSSTSSNTDVVSVSTSTGSFLSSSTSSMTSSTSSTSSPSSTSALSSTTSSTSTSTRTSSNVSGTSSSSSLAPPQ
eukprot:TRINITY_DN18789_c0_g1_i1.p1 TRINITY_DN18789_c0_g1~~TRINITY_DN18789_c0_g1_i1.p1  ORF type:complete len:342 (-),score=89.13 TRINITY_DN18789_c0_g1_i1:15-1040(-)